MALAYVYILKDPFTHDIRYVGVTEVSIARRYSHHIGDARRGECECHKCRWIRRCIATYQVPPYVEALAQVPADHRDAAESYWIGYFRSIGCDLTNMTLGGDRINRYFSPTHRENISMAKKGVPKSEAHKALLAESCSGWSHTDEAKTKISQALQEQWKSGARDESRKKISEASRKAYQDPDVRRRHSEAVKAWHAKRRTQAN